jgi:hypothetical protein
LQEIDIALIEGAIKINKVFLYPELGENFDRLLHNAILNLLAIVDDEASFKRTEQLWIIPEDIRAELLNNFGKMPEEKARTFLRQCIELVFELDEKDITLFLRNRIYIRGYAPPKAVPEGTERRYAGEDPDEMTALFEHLFPEGILEEIEEYLPEVLDESLNFTLIDNITFNKIYIPTYRSMIEIILLDAVADFPEEKLEGFTGYVLRQYFDDILVYTARELLYYVEERDKNAEQFIKYYKDEVIIDTDGKKIQKYAIIDAKNQTWNYSAILSVLIQFTQAKKRVEQQEERLESIEVRIEEAMREVGFERQEKEKSEQYARELNEIVSLKKNQLSRSMAEASDAILQAQLNKEHSELLDNLKVAKDNALFAGRRYRNKQTELENWKKQYTTNKKQMDEIRQQNETIVEMIDLIVDAVAVVFAKR